MLQVGKGCKILGLVVQVHGRANCNRYRATNCAGAFYCAVQLVGLFGSPKDLLS